MSSQCNNNFQGFWPRAVRNIWYLSKSYHYQLGNKCKKGLKISHNSPFPKFFFYNYHVRCYFLLLLEIGDFNASVLTQRQKREGYYNDDESNCFQAVEMNGGESIISSAILHVLREERGLQEKGGNFYTVIFSPNRIYDVTVRN